MTMMSRRQFMEKTAIASGAAGLLAASAGKLEANPLGLPIGSQIKLGPMLNRLLPLTTLLPPIGSQRKLGPMLNLYFL